MAKKCKMCKEPFKAVRPLQFLCSMPCSVQYAKQLAIKNESKKTKVLKESLLTRTDYIKILQVKINALVRIIDNECTCISCGKIGKPQAGHYHSTQASPELRFNLHNIHLQDYRCNVELSANIVGYNDGLIKVYSIGYKEFVETGLRNQYKYLKLTIDEVKKAIDITNKIIKEMPKNEKYTPIERIALRDLANDKIGIYN